MAVLRDDFVFADVLDCCAPPRTFLCGSKVRRLCGVVLRDRRALCFFFLDARRVLEPGREARFFRETITLVFLFDTYIDFFPRRALCCGAWPS